MLASEKIIGFLVTRDYDRAREFFEKKLGITYVSLDAYALVMRAGETMIRITKNPGFQPAQGTVLGWEVRDIEKTVAWLKGQGIAMEKYPFVEDKESGIWNAPGGDRVAWFKDPDGNVLSVSQHIAP
ncbi:MAG TPA: VOC family protein [Candidatus Acidoferrum sp.]|nr:VOC family protein [Candidatus Acidoferrum sp.]